MIKHLFAGTVLLLSLSALFGTALTQAQEAKGADRFRIEERDNAPDGRLDVVDKKGDLVVTRQEQVGGIIAPAKRNPKDGAEMVWIPAGEFLMGTPPSVIDKLVKEYHLPDTQGEGPQHPVTLSGYYLYQTPVTVAQYRQFCVATQRAMPAAPEFNPHWSKTDHTIVNVSWNDASAYCEWAGGRLPTEAEWEKAAAWDAAKHRARTFPWGEDWAANRLWCSTRRHGDAGGTKPVGSYPSGASYYGALDMEGNVCQWCSDWYAKEFYRNPLATAPNAENRSVGEKWYRVVRGTSWQEKNDVDFRSAVRGDLDPRASDEGLGFRCVVALQK